MEYNVVVWTSRQGQSRGVPQRDCIDLNQVESLYCIGDRSFLPAATVKPARVSVGQVTYTDASRVLERLQAYLQDQRAAALPKSPLSAAIGYALRNWVALTRYLEDGRLKIDNNGAEQALRPIVLGRKNWLFAGSEAAAHRTAILCSLVQTCKHLQINPFVYLRDVIERVSTHPARLVLELTPREWKGLRRDSGAQAAA